MVERFWFVGMCSVCMYVCMYVCMVCVASYVCLLLVILFVIASILISQDGNSRSPAIVLGYLIVNMGLSFETAYEEILERRPLINPNAGFISQLKYMAR
jgi:hypothetical protein